MALLAGLAVPVARGRLVYDLFSRGSVGCRRSEDGLYEAGLLMDEIEAAVESSYVNNFERESTPRKRRTLTTSSATLGFCFVPAIRAYIVKLQRRTELCRPQNKGLVQRLKIAMLGFAIALSLKVTLLALALLFVLVVPEAFLEERGDGIGNALELLVAFLLCSLETTVDVASDEGHRHSVGPRGMATAADGRGLGLGRECW